MFTKKQMIFSEALGLCRVENIVELHTEKNGKGTAYYVLTPVKGPEQSAYLPVEGHTQKLRELFTLEETAELYGSKLYREDQKLRDAVDYCMRLYGK